MFVLGSCVYSQKLYISVCVWVQPLREKMFGRSLCIYFERFKFRAGEIPVIQQVCDLNSDTNDWNQCATIANIYYPFGRTVEFITSMTILTWESVTHHWCLIVYMTYFVVREFGLKLLEATVVVLHLI